MKKNIVFLDGATFPKHLKFDKIDFSHTWKSHPTTSPAEVTKRIKTAHVLINNKVNLGANELQHAKNLELIALTATGTNIIDLEYCKKNNIKVCNLRDYAAITVAEHAFALMLSLYRQIKGLEQDITSGLWQKQKVFSMVNRRVFNLYDKHNSSERNPRDHINYRLSRLYWLSPQPPVAGAGQSASKLLPGYSSRRRAWWALACSRKRCTASSEKRTAFLSKLPSAVVATATAFGSSSNRRLGCGICRHAGRAADGRRAATSTHGHSSWAGSRLSPLRTDGCVRS